MKWDVSTPLCGNCRFWPLSGYGKHSWDYGSLTSLGPSGQGGYNTDGSVSGCRRHAPIKAADREGGVISYALWPETFKTDFCGDFESRPGFGSAKLKED